MGLLGGILLAPISGPVWGFRMLIERMAEEADAVLHDEGRGYAELMELSMRRSAGTLSEAEYAEQEAALLERLAAIREYKEELAQAEAWVGEDEWMEDDAQLDEDVLGEELDLIEDALRDAEAGDQEVAS